MDLGKALAQISEINGVLSRAEVYRGYRPRTMAITGVLACCAALLPGLWSLSFSLGIFAARPNLPRGIGWVGLFYLLAGTLLLTPVGTSLGALGMGGAFGFGQLFMALVLYWNLERKPDHV